jgi:hypothetical protein
MVLKPGAAALASTDGDAVFWLGSASPQNIGLLHILYRSNIDSRFRTAVTSDGAGANLNIRTLGTDATESEQLISFGGANTNLRRNGALQTGGATGTAVANTISYSNAFAEIGNYSNITTTQFCGAFDLAEFVLLPSASDADILNLDGYLAHKWGLAANLPSDHPFKASPPMI